MAAKQKPLTCVALKLTSEASQGEWNTSQYLECCRWEKNKPPGFRCSANVSVVLYESSALAGHRDAARFSFAHPLVPMARHIIIDGITQGAREDNADIE